MKWIRFGLVPVLALTLATVAVADDKTATTKPASTAKHGGGDWNKSPDEMAKQALDKWQKTLKLTDAQKPQFESIMKDSMHGIMADRDAALAKVLTPDQMKTYNEKMEKMKSEGKKKWDKASKEAKEDADKDEKSEKK